MKRGDIVKKIANDEFPAGFRQWYGVLVSQEVAVPLVTEGIAEPSQPLHSSYIYTPTGIEEKIIRKRFHLQIEHPEDMPPFERTLTNVHPTDEKGDKMYKVCVRMRYADYGFEAMSWSQDTIRKCLYKATDNARYLCSLLGLTRINKEVTVLSEKEHKKRNMKIATILIECYGFRA